MKIETAWIRNGALVLAALATAACTRDDAYGDEDVYAKDRDTTTLDSRSAETHGTTGGMPNDATHATTAQANQPAGGVHGAGTSAKGQDAQAATQTLSAAKFVEEAARSGKFEVRAAEMLLDQEVSEPIQELANTIKDDHEEANDDLEDIAEELKITVPTALAPDQQQMLSDLEGKQGMALERAYLEQQIAAHQKAIDLFERAEKQLDHERLSSFAHDKLPVLRKHLEMLRQTQTK